MINKIFQKILKHALHILNHVRPPHVLSTLEQFKEFVKRLELSHILDQELKAYKSDILNFLEGCSTN